MTLKIDIEELNKELAERQIECLSPEYTRSSDKYEWLCLKCGHRWKTTHNSVVLQGTGCYRCSYVERANDKIIKLTIEEINEKLKDRNIECLSEQYIKSNTKYTWACLTCGHIWKTSYNNIKNNKHGCIKCVGRKTSERCRLKITIDEINNILRNRRIECLSKKEDYKNNNTKLKWHCLKCDNIWEATYHNVIDNEQGCPKCGFKIISDKLRLKITIDEINQQLKSRNIICLSEKYNTSRTKYKWECLCCHLIWETTYDSIFYNETGCRRCSIENHSGENHHNWRGGSKDYPPEFNNSKKEFIRNRDERKCQYPECEYDDTKEKQKLDVHHINGDKKNCENWNLISLCHKHHMKIQPRYEEWEDYFYAITDSFEYA